MLEANKVDIEIELTTEFIDSDLEELLCTRHCILERELKPRRNRKLPTTEMVDHLNERVPGRNREIEHVAKFIENLRFGDRSPLCLHGSTGCGKTSIIGGLLNFLQSHYKNFKVLYINCLSYLNIKKIYSEILDYFFNRKDRKPEQLLSTLFQSTGSE